MSQYDFTTSLEKDNTTQNKNQKIKKLKKKTKNKQTRNTAQLLLYKRQL